MSARKPTPAPAHDLTTAPGQKAFLEDVFRIIPDQYTLAGLLLVAARSRLRLLRAAGEDDEAQRVAALIEAARLR